MKENTKILISLVLLALVDMIIPIPFAAILLIYVLFNKPLWFKNMVDYVYETRGTS